MAEEAAELPVQEETGRRAPVGAAGPELTVVGSGPQAAAETTTELNLDEETEESLARRWGAHLRPPDVWREPIPPLAAQWARWRAGVHLPDAPPARVATGVCLGLASLFGMAAVVAHWAAASPARLAALAAGGAAIYVVASTLLSLVTALFPNF